MKLKILIFDDQMINIECYQDMLNDKFLVSGFTETINYEQVLQKNKPHGILLDLHMPVYDGFVLHDKITHSDHYNGCPIFFISGDLSDESRLRAITSGGIDFFNRSIGKEELTLRLSSKIKSFLQGDTLIDLGNLRLDTFSFNAYINDKLTELSLIEMRILSLVMRRMPDPVHKNELMTQIWGDTSSQGKMYVHLSNIKSKLAAWNHELRIRDNFIVIDAV
jgi:DNA-binding response OmpR family regulator